ncbi:MAG: nitrate reductase molybdenum cofactor assembly chaperone [Thermoanaerobaculia bacterium]
MSVAALEALAPLFRYPDAAFPRHVDEARRVVPALETFARETAALDRASLEVTYTSTFDLAPSCSPYLGAHLFGDDSRARARLMLGLQRNGPSSELPDHIAEVLANARAFDENEWRELEELVLLPTLAKMNEILAATENPYRHLVAATRSLLPPDPCPLRPESGGAP